MSFKHARAKRHTQSPRTLARKFFLDNPDEELTYEQAGVKFGRNRNQLIDMVSRLKTEGLVEVVSIIRARSKEQNAKS